MANIIGRFKPKYVQSKVVEAPRMTFQTFYKKYIEPGNSAVGGVKYEYCNGFVEQTTTMNPKKLFLVQHLTGLFYRMKQKTDGTIVNELETWTSKVSWRKPDWAYVTQEQIALGRNDEPIVPEFMVEMLSKNDDILVVQKKIRENQRYPRHPRSNPSPFAIFAPNEIFKRHRTKFVQKIVARHG